MNSNILKIDDFEFISFESGRAKVYFSTSKGNLDFNKNKKEGLDNLNKLKKWFDVKEVGYLNQIHSDIIYVFDGNMYDGDAIITDKKKIAIGVFTADCVPVLIYDKKLNISSAVHSGWKGTIKCIVKKTIDKMIYSYGSNIDDIIVWIGPHNKECCYEVSEDLIEKFKNIDIYKEININKGRYLSLEKCILGQLDTIGINKNNVILLNKCTYCDRENGFFSYRRDNDKSGRMFSFIIVK